jgi:two-component system NarL family sensor kinase
VLGLSALRRRLASSIGAQVLAGFGLSVAVALLVALVSLSAARDTTARLEALQEAQRRMVAALKDLELSTELQSSSVQAFLLSGDERYLEGQARGRALFEEGFSTLESMTLADEGLDQLDQIARARERFESSALSQLVLYRQGWPRSSTFLWRGEGADTKEQLEREIQLYRTWYETAVLEDVTVARSRGSLAMLVSVLLVLTAALVGLVVGLRLTRSITHRLGALAGAAEVIGRGDFSARVALAGFDEVAALGSAMNQMAAHLEDAQRALDQSRQKLRESLEQYRLLSENAMDIVYALDVSGRYSYVNAAIEQMAGYKPHEVLGRHFVEFLPEELRASRIESFERRMRGEDVGTMAEIEYLAKDGRRVPLELRLATIEAEGRIVGMQGIARDVTRRRAMEAQIRRLAEQEHRRAEQLQEVARVGRRVTQLASLEALLPNVAGLVNEVFGYPRVAIFLTDPDSGLAHFRAWAGEYAAPLPSVFSQAPEQGIIGWVAAHGEPLRCGDVRAEPRYIEVPATAGTQSELAAPIRAAGEVIGVLDVQSCELDAFDANDEATLTILADQVGTAIQNARLFEQQHSLAVAEERNRLAREIHDTLAQGLTGITLQLEVADALLDVGPEDARPKIHKALELTRANLEEARRSVMDLRAAPLQDRTLTQALEELVSTFGVEEDVRADFAAHGVGGRLPSALEAGLYRIAQEALNNVARHADATTVHLTLERQEDSLVLCVEDNGTGFDPTAPPPSDRRKGGFGLVGMHERARLLGGQLVVNSAPNEGTRLVISVPAARYVNAPPSGNGATGDTQPLAHANAGLSGVE